MKLVAMWGAGWMVNGREQFVPPESARRLSLPEPKTCPALSENSTSNGESGVCGGSSFRPLMQLDLFSTSKGSGTTLFLSRSPTPSRSGRRLTLANTSDESGTAPRSTVSSSVTSGFSNSPRKGGPTTMLSGGCRKAIGSGKQTKTAIGDTVGPTQRGRGAL